ncbi:MAG: glycosyltransferase family 4 protein [Muribaculum sp.]|nr:glycosyltransferase family 4 protein [Muribaculum sp.]
MNKKLLFFASDYQIGLSAVLADQLISLHDAGVNLHAVAGEREQEFGLWRTVEDKNISIECIKGLDVHSNFKGLVSRIGEVIVRENIHVVHVQNNWQLALVYVVKNKLRLRRKIEIAYTIHGFRNNRPFKAKIAQAVIGTALFIASDYVICMTKYLKNKFSMLSYKICLVPLGVKDDFFTDEFMEPAVDSLRIIFPAQFREGKNQDLIIRAFKNYINLTNDNNSILTLPGGGDLLEKTKALACELKIADRVQFPGLVSKERIRQLYIESNVAIVASNSETFGQSIVEPFVLGRCVLSTPVGIASEIIQDEENGYIFRTEKRLTELFVKLSEDKKRLRSIGKNNFNLRDMFRWRTITEHYRKNLGV